MIAPPGIVVDRLLNESPANNSVGASSDYLSGFLDKLWIGDFDYEGVCVWWAIKDEICVCGFALLAADGDRCKYERQN